MKLTQQFEPMALYRNRETGRTSTNLREVLPKTATVVRGHRCEPNRKGTGALFHEVAFVPAEEALTPEQQRLLAAPIATTPMDAAGLAANMARVVTEAIAQRWAPDKLHLIFHSGGYDSRIMSAAIRKLYEQRGVSWLGRVRFVCIGNECETAERVLRAEGWDGWESIAIRDMASIIQWTTDIAAAGKRLNGISLQRLDYNYALIEYLQAHGYIHDADDGIQVLSGRNETLMGATMPERNRLGWSWREAYNSYLSVSRYKVADVVFPFGAHEVVALGLSSTHRVDWSTPERDEKAGYRRSIGVALCPALADIPRTTLLMPKLSAADVERMRLDYSRTWYGQNIWPEATRDVTDNLLLRHSWWGAWSAAALCDALLREGWKLNVD